EAMWNGTKNLISTSKVGQMPRLLMQVIHKEENYHIGELDKRIKFVSAKNDEEIRDISDGILDITELAQVLNNNKESILKIRYKVDDRVQLALDTQRVTIQDVLGEIELEELSF
ncbi:MAG TPA: type I-B CRISPR-associated protein Cas7/Csh2, partial [bacterium]|nr:type I-B CRISPR-associated protein Cas7/Csh2 [bacterium]